MIEFNLPVDWENRAVFAGRFRERNPGPQRRSRFLQSSFRRITVVRLAPEQRASVLMNLFMQKSGLSALSVSARLKRRLMI